MLPLVVPSVTLLPLHYHNALHSSICFLLHWASLYCIVPCYAAKALPLNAWLCCASFQNPWGIFEECWRRFNDYWNYSDNISKDDSRMLWALSGNSSKAFQERWDLCRNATRLLPEDFCNTFCSWTLSVPALDQVTAGLTYRCGSNSQY